MRGERWKRGEIAVGFRSALRAGQHHTMNKTARAVNSRRSPMPPLPKEKSSVGKASLVTDEECEGSGGGGAGGAGGGGGGGRYYVCRSEQLSPLERRECRTRRLRDPPTKLVSSPQREGTKSVQGVHNKSREYKGVLNCRALKFSKVVEREARGARPMKGRPRGKESHRYPGSPGLFNIIQPQGSPHRGGVGGGGRPSPHMKDPLDALSDPHCLRKLKRELLKGGGLFNKRESNKLCPKDPLLEGNIALSRLPIRKGGRLLHRRKGSFRLYGTGAGKQRACNQLVFNQARVAKFMDDLTLTPWDQRSFHEENSNLASGVRSRDMITITSTHSQHQ